MITSARKWTTHPPRNTPANVRFSSVPRGPSPAADSTIAGIIVKSVPHLVYLVQTRSLNLESVLYQSRIHDAFLVSLFDSYLV